MNTDINPIQITSQWWNAIYNLSVPGPTVRPQYMRFDHVGYRVLEQLVVYTQNYMNVITHQYKWKGHGRSWKPMKWVFNDLTRAMNESPDAMMSRTMICLDEKEYCNQQSFVDPEITSTALSQYVPYSTQVGNSHGNVCASIQHPERRAFPAHDPV